VRRSSVPSQIPPKVKMNMIPAEMKELMNNSADWFTPRTSSFQFQRLRSSIGSPLASAGRKTVQRTALTGMRGSTAS